MVRQGVDVATKAHAMRVPFYMENPVGSLWRRPYMAEWLRKKCLVRATGHCCLFGGFCHKPAHFCTNTRRW